MLIRSLRRSQARVCARKIPMTGETLVETGSTARFWRGLDAGLECELKLPRKEACELFRPTGGGSVGRQCVAGGGLSFQ